MKVGDYVKVIHDTLHVGWCDKIIPYPNMDYGLIRVQFDNTNDPYTVIMSYKQLEIITEEEAMLCRLRT